MFLDARPVLRPPTEIAVVFQDYSRSLFPWLTVVRNVMFPLRRTRRRARSGSRRPRRPSRNSACAASRASTRGSSRAACNSGSRSRALVSRPEILLLDEPFASVDALTRAEHQDVLLRVHGEHRRVTIVHVTHDIDEAACLADRVLVMSPAPGRVVRLVDVELPRPRAQTATRSSDRFLAVRNEIQKAITEQQALQQGGERE